MKLEGAAELDRLDFDKGDGLVAVVAQDAASGRVLMLAWADRPALERTLETGELWLWSRSRAKPWHKGATSGNVQRVRSLHADCDGDAVLALVEPAGPACHTGEVSCFSGAAVLPALADVLRGRRASPPEGSYTARLLGERNLRLKKLGEETAELVVALVDGDRERVAEEAADLLYHVLVAALAEGVEPEAMLRALGERLG
ncbi:MAG TPA: bifunctional phosphoribosyl-AMP cyclohydrolase/phosphoribosyl-ATP diphosphatase HisIE [Longimicrobiales bacterium]|nr:bifunctional phosphoribosyl-AMP cyclohydrolase/phosphoribosyl-ATP diphosphatase HisIE [Longimicrobiales bacterium]